MCRFDSVELEQLDERLGTREVAENPHRRLGLTLEQRRSERDLIGLAARRIGREVADREVDLPALVMPKEPPEVRNSAH